MSSQIIKVTSTNFVLLLTDTTQTAGAGQSLRVLSDEEVTTFSALSASGRVIDDPEAGLRAATSAEVFAQLPLARQLKTVSNSLVGAFQGITAGDDAGASTRALLGPVAGYVLIAVSNNDLAGAKAAITAASNPEGSALSSDQFAALKATLLSCFPS